jgi:hypothetical protein
MAMASPAAGIIKRHRQNGSGVAGGGGWHRTAARSARALLISIKNISGGMAWRNKIGGSKIIAWQRAWAMAPARKHQKKAAAAIGENGVARSKMAAAAAWRKSNGGIGGSNGKSLKISA